MQATNSRHRSRCRSCACATGSVCGRRDRGWRGTHSVRDAEHRDRLELQPLHAVHRADADRVLPRLGRQRHGDRDARRFQRGGGLLRPGTRTRAAMPIACGSMPSPIQPRTRSASAASSASRDPAAMHLGSASVQRRAVAGQRIGLVVQAGDRRLAERGNGEGQDLLRGAVVDGQPAAAPAHVDADLRERDVVVVDPLVRVADDEHVVGARRDGGAQQPPLRRVQVLGLVDDHVPVGRLAGRRGGTGRPRWRAAGTWTGPCALSCDSTCWASCQTWRRCALPSGVPCPAREHVR